MTLSSIIYNQYYIVGNMNRGYMKWNEYGNMKSSRRIIRLRRWKDPQSNRYCRRSLCLRLDGNDAKVSLQGFL